jgi:adenylate cyclase, class 2
MRNAWCPSSVSDTAPARNLELKARDPDPAASLAAALALGAEDRGLLHQRDTYFAVPHGRLKLRREDGRAELIQYERPDAATACESRYRVVPVPDPDALEAALTAALGVDMAVVKARRLLLWQGVRIHLDRVEGLGDFVELEAVAAPDSDLSAEAARVATLRAALAIEDDLLLAAGYRELLSRPG